MNFLDSLNERLTHWHLLRHPFYQAWNGGTLKLETLQCYAQEYYHHVAAFPRYLSCIHSLCPSLTVRQILLAYLLEEEAGEDNHPELWQRFAEGLGITRNQLHQPIQFHATLALVEGYFELTRSDFATGLGALYAYERQTPDVAHTKMEGLKKHYAVEDARSLQFFTVHREADVWHTAEVASILEGLDETAQNKAAQGAESGAKYLWGFLDGLMIHAC